MKEKNYSTFKQQPGKKFDGDKQPIVQGVLHYFPKALLEVAKVSKYGAEKYNVPYSNKNWERLLDAFNRYSDGMGRHLLGEVIEGPIDRESGELHIAMVAWNALARLELYLRDLEEKEN